MHNLFSFLLILEDQQEVANVYFAASLAHGRTDVPYDLRESPLAELRRI